MYVVTNSISASWPQKSTSRLSAKCRKNVLSVRPARSCDLRDRGLVEPALGVEVQGRLLQAAARVGLPPAHAAILGE